MVACGQVTPERGDAGVLSRQPLVDCQRVLVRLQCFVQMARSALELPHVVVDLGQLALKPGDAGVLARSRPQIASVLPKDSSA